MTNETTQHIGTPLEIGASVFQKHCLPVIKSAAEMNGTTRIQMGQLYAGFIIGAFGAMVAEFGEHSARDFFDQIHENLPVLSPGVAANDPA